MRACRGILARLRGPHVPAVGPAVRPRTAVARTAVAELPQSPSRTCHARGTRSGRSEATSPRAGRARRRGRAGARRQRQHGSAGRRARGAQRSARSARHRCRRSPVVGHPPAPAGSRRRIRDHRGRPLQQHGRAGGRGQLPDVVDPVRPGRPRRSGRRTRRRGGSAPSAPTGRPGSGPRRRRVPTAHHRRPPGADRPPAASRRNSPTVTSDRPRPGPMATAATRDAPARTCAAHPSTSTGCDTASVGAPVRPTPGVESARSPIRHATRPSRQSRRAGHLRRAGDEPDGVAPLVVVGRAVGHQGDHVGIGHQVDRRGRHVEADVGDLDPTAVGRARRQHEARLERGEGDRGTACQGGRCRAVSPSCPRGCRPPAPVPLGVRER